MDVSNWYFRLKDAFGEFFTNVTWSHNAILDPKVVRHNLNLLFVIAILSMICAIVVLLVIAGTFEKYFGVSKKSIRPLGNVDIQSTPHTQAKVSQIISKGEKIDETAF